MWVLDSATCTALRSGWRLSLSYTLGGRSGAFWGIRDGRGVVIGSGYAYGSDVTVICSGSAWQGVHLEVDLQTLHGQTWARSLRPGDMLGLVVVSSAIRGYFDSWPRWERLVVRVMREGKRSTRIRSYILQCGVARGPSVSMVRLQSEGVTCVK